MWCVLKATSPFSPFQENNVRTISSFSIQHAAQDKTPDATNPHIQGTSHTTSLHPQGDQRTPPQFVHAIVQRTPNRSKLQYQLHELRKPHLHPSTDHPKNQLQLATKLQHGS